MRQPFFEKLERAVVQNNSLLCVGLDPQPEQAPAPHRRDSAAETILAWNQAVIEATADLVCAFKPNIAFYEALGGAGLSALRRTLAHIPPHIPIILDAKRGDIGSTANAYAKACFEELDVDAVTLSPYLGRDSIEPFARFSDRGLFVLCHTSNPSAGDFQHLEICDWRQLDREPNQPLYLHVARAAVRWAPNVGLVVGATFPTALDAVRQVAPRAWFLVPGVGAQGGDLEATVRAALRSDRSGAIVNASRGVCLADDPRAAALALRNAINRIRTPPAAPVADSANAASAPTADLRTFILDLYNLGAVKFGNFTLASGLQSPIYVDLRLLVSQPRLLAQAARFYADALADLPCDRLCGVPYAALPIATAVALEADKPLIYPRKEAKTHGLGREIEGAWKAGDRVVIIEDLITSGGSTMQTAETLRTAGLVVEHAIVLIDRQQGGAQNLAVAGVTVHSVLRLVNILDTLVAEKKISQEQRETVLKYMGV